MNLSCFQEYYASLQSYALQTFAHGELTGTVGLAEVEDTLPKGEARSEVEVSTTIDHPCQVTICF
jgi:hypothetical protein